MRKFLIIGFLISISIGCSEKKDNIDILEEYIYEDMNIDYRYTAPHAFIIIPANSCSPCQGKLIEFVNEFEEDAVEKFTYIMIGKSQKELNILFNDLEEKHNVFFDQAQIGLKNEIITSPVLFLINSSQKKIIKEYPNANYYEKLKTDMLSFLNGE